MPRPRLLAVRAATAVGAAGKDAGPRAIDSAPRPATSQMSRVLARLVALIENTVNDPALFEANAWQLTASGKNLQSAIRRESLDAGLKGPRGASPSRAAMVNAKSERSLSR
jgi:hypothetical protein